MLLGCATSLSQADPGARPPGPQAGGPRIDWSARTGSFDLRLDDRLRREARRFPDLTGPRIEPGPIAPAEADDGTRAERGRRVERLLMRAIRGALDDQISERARESGSLSGLFRLIDARDDAKTETAGGSARRGADAGAAVTPDPPATSFRLRLDAHPRLQWRAHLGAFTGSVEVPVLDPELRFGLERPLGSSGRAALSGGHSSDRGGWASLALNFSF
ncbi:MAG TPA: hypothetical protein VFQ07_05540 [Candidatus Polarisedimenticolia bacterium]|nr:hypothetical protein [Candidatus Polarisedimenticolia bacterium]